MAHHVYRYARLGASVLINASWYKATDFLDVDAQCGVFVDIVDRVLPQDQSPLDAVRTAAETDQKIND